MPPQRRHVHGVARRRPHPVVGIHQGAHFSPQKVRKVVIPFIAYPCARPSVIVSLSTLAKDGSWNFMK